MVTAIQILGFVIGFLYLISTALEHITTLKKRKSFAALPLLSVVIVFPIWFTGLINIDVVAKNAAFFLGSEIGSISYSVVILSVSSSMLVFLAGFTRSMYTITLLDNGDWWELKHFEGAFIFASNKLYWSEFILRCSIAITFILHQSSINQLVFLSNHIETEFLSLPTSFYSLGAMFGLETIKVDNVIIAEAYELVWFQAAITGYLVFLFIYLWTIVTSKTLKNYAVKNRKSIGNLDDFKTFRYQLSEQIKTQTWAFFMGVAVTSWILIFSQTSLINNPTLLTVFAAVGVIGSLLMIYKVFSPQLLKLSIRLLDLFQGKIK